MWLNWSPVSEAVLTLHVSLFLSHIVLKSKGTLSEKPTTNLRNIHKTARTRYSSIIWTPAISIRTRATWRPWRDQLTDWNRDRRSYHLLCQLPSPFHRTIGCSKNTASIFVTAKVLGRLASVITKNGNGISGSWVVACVNFGVKKTSEWLQGDLQEPIFSQRRLAACFVLKDSARVASTLFHTNSMMFFQSI